MPAYDYKCDDCGIVWEEIRPIADRDIPAICPKCQEVAHRTFTGVPHLMWYPGSTRPLFKEKRVYPE